MADSKPKGLRIMSMILLMGIFALGGMSGAFLYATGEQVITDTWMQMISHTEYRYGEDGQIIARLVDYQGTAVVVDNCTATILYPDKTFFVNAALMNDTGNIAGDHYYEFVTPNGPEGVYEYQATCSYTLGTVRTKSVTNSFHLSSAFNSVLGNLTQLSSDLAAVNSSLSADVAGVASDIADLSTAVGANFTAITNQLNSNVTTILAAIDVIDVNFIPILDAIDALNASNQASFSTVITNQGTINTTVNDIKSTVDAMELVLNNVNATTTNTYQYVTGTLTTKVDLVLTNLGVINATVNRIELNTVDINSTVNTILENQQDEVFMTTFSG